MGTKIFVLTGPTGSGKSNLSLELAKFLDAQIISADSMAIYRKMNIGTAKPSAEEQKSVKHHLIDIRDPWETYDTANFVNDASHLIKEIKKKKNNVLIVGGTALYIKSLIYGIFDSPPANLEMRRQLQDYDKQYLYNKLCEIDKKSAKKIEANDLRRIVRALEVYYNTGIKISQWHEKHTKPIDNYECCMIGINWERPVLYKRIEYRVDQMMKQGLIEETKELLKLPYPISHTASQAIGYKETIEAIKKENFSNLANNIKQNSRRFAKRQMTWLKRFPVSWIECDNDTSTKSILEKAKNLVLNFLK